MFTCLLAELDPLSGPVVPATTRTLNRLRGFRALATCHDNRDVVYRGTIDVASIRLRLPEPYRQDPRDTH